jgi:hypothetical protein
VRNDAALRFVPADYFVHGSGTADRHRRHATGRSRLTLNPAANNWWNWEWSASSGSGSARFGRADQSAGHQVEVGDDEAVPGRRRGTATSSALHSPSIRLAEAERELRELRLENEFLKKAAAYFAKDRR